MTYGHGKGPAGTGGALPRFPARYGGQTVCSRTAGRRLAMTRFASERGLVRKPYPQDMCMVASATGICARALSGRPLPAGSDPATIAAA